MAFLMPSVTQFAMPMGLMGIGLSAGHFETLLGWSHSFSYAWFIFAWLAFSIVTIPYIVLWVFPDGKIKLQEEWQHPFKISLFSAISLTLILAVASLKTFDTPYRWIVACYFTVVVFHTWLSFHLFSRWLFDAKISLNHLKPTWFVILSGNFAVVIAGAEIVPGDHEFLWFYFSASLFMWFTIATAMFYRLIFEKPLDIDMRPSLFIFMAPPSLGVVAALNLMSIDEAQVLVWMLYGFALMMLIQWLTVIKHFWQSELSMGVWAYVYPVAAFGLANQYFGAVLSDPFFLWFAGIIFLLNITTVLLLTVLLLKKAVYSLFAPI